MTKQELQIALDAISASWDGVYDISDAKQLSIDAIDEQTIRLHWCEGYRYEKYDHEIPPQSEDWVYGQKRIKFNGTIRDLVARLTYEYELIEQLPDPEEKIIG
jgi:hypothetical protein